MSGQGFAGVPYVDLAKTFVTTTPMYSSSVTTATWTVTVDPMDEVVNAFHGLAAACRDLAEAQR